MTNANEDNRALWCVHTVLLSHELLKTGVETRSSSEMTGPSRLRFLSSNSSAAAASFVAPFPFVIATRHVAETSPAIRAHTVTARCNAAARLHFKSGRRCRWGMGVGWGEGGRVLLGVSFSLQAVL